MVYTIQSLIDDLQDVQDKSQPVFASVFTAHSLDAWADNIGMDPYTADELNSLFKKLNLNHCFANHILAYITDMMQANPPANQYTPQMASENTYSVEGKPPF